VDVIFKRLGEQECRRVLKPPSRSSPRNLIFIADWTATPIASACVRYRFDDTLCARLPVSYTGILAPKPAPTSSSQSPARADDRSAISRPHPRFLSIVIY
jgi:hypothetical protein